LSRGDRSRPERTAQERQRDREERERRRAGLAGSDPGPSAGEPVGDPPFEPPSPDDGAPVEEPLPPEHVFEPEPVEPAPVQDLPVDLPESEEPAWLDEPESVDLPAEPAPQDFPEEPAPDDTPAVEHPAAELAQPPVPAAHPAPEAERPPPVDEEIAAVFEPIPPEPAGAYSQGISPEPPEEVHPEPELAPARSAPPRRDGAPALSAPPPLPPLPAGPRGRREPPGSSPRRTARPLARIAALVALAAVVVVAIILLVHSLTKSKSEKPPVAPPVVKVLVSEGKTRAQIVQVAKAAGLKGSYRDAAKSSSLLNPVHYGAPKGTPDLEGFLFPATYELDRGSQASELVREQLIAFQENFSSEYFRRAKALHVSAYQLLIVASMVEREAQVPGDRSKIAAVIYNRLADGMPLGIDASIYYAVEEQLHVPTYTHELTVSQLHIDSPYNTRTHTGLPPTPISNPGVASIKAAAHPAHVAYLYYVAAADGCGEQVFSDTQAEFEANAASYEAAVKRNGGHPPSCKHH
jgi:UPF0755 protein